LARPCASPDLGLALADGSRWAIRGLDSEAAATVRKLGRVMGLGPARGGHELRVVSGWKGGFSGRAVVCRLGPARRFGEAYRMERVANVVVEHSLAKGGLLLHGALAVRDGLGFVLAGPSGVGKSTASRRLPLPWQPLSDDCVLVVRDRDGHYWAHPWPTWSLLRSRGPVKSWPVEEPVPLQALMFLNQSSFDRAEPVGATLATALVMESALRLIDAVTLTQDGCTSRAVCRKYLRAVWALAVAVPAFRLQVSLTGRFWNEIERTASMEPRIGTDGHGYGRRIEQNSDAREQNAELRREGTGSGRARATKTRNTRIGFKPPPRRVLRGSPQPRLVRFQTRERTFLKVVRGRRVVASVNDLLREWYYRGSR